MIGTYYTSPLISERAFIYRSSYKPRLPALRNEMRILYDYRAIEYLQDKLEE